LPFFYLLKTKKERKNNMRIIDTGITKEILSGENFPQLKIADKLYTVDNRQKTYDEITKVQKDINLDDNEKTRKIYELALGKEATKEILELNLPVENTVFLSYCIMGAIIGEDPKKLQDEARKN
jgi:hypothetical protein